MKYKKVCQFSIVITFIILFTLLLTANSPLENQNLKNKNPYQVNKNGQTYGPNYGSPTIEDPDLMAAYGTDGTFGYVLASDLSSNPRTPEEAIEQQKNRKSPRFIPLYDKDGKTVLGTFKIGN